MKFACWNEKYILAFQIFRFEKKTLMSTRISVKLAEENLAKNPEEEANIFSKWFFMYLNSLFKKGRKFPIVEDDIPYPTEGRDKN